jgi:hypothetical protein
MFLIIFKIKINFILYLIKFYNLDNRIHNKKLTL